MYKEGHRRKTFKKRYFVVWPRDYREMTMDAPVLFYYDSDQDGQVRVRSSASPFYHPSVVRLACAHGSRACWRGRSFFADKAWQTGRQAGRF